jgi:tetratricopeptide (TPR) repeat protein
MRCCHEFRKLVAFGVLAVIAAGSSVTLAQSSVLSASADVPEMPQSVAAGQNAKITPEDVGDALMLRQRYQAAIAEYQKSAQESPIVWNKMGMANQMMFNLQEAARCYQVSLKLNPNNPHVLNNLGTIYNSQKLYGDAERMYRKAVRLDPGSALIYRNLGSALLAEHNYKKGWEAYQKALTLDPQIFVDRASAKVENPGSAADRGAMNYYMARGCIHAGLNDCAIDHLRRALNEGFTDEKKIQADGEFAGLHGIPAFQQLLAAQRLQ